MRQERNEMIGDERAFYSTVVSCGSPGNNWLRAIGQRNLNNDSSNHYKAVTVPVIQITPVSTWLSTTSLQLLASGTTITPAVISSVFHVTPASTWLPVIFFPVKKDRFEVMFYILTEFIRRGRYCVLSVKTKTKKGFVRNLSTYCSY